MAENMNGTTSSNSTKKSPIKTLCKLKHPIKFNSHDLFYHKDWSQNENEKLVELIFRSISLSYSAYNIAGYIKNILGIPIHCVHTIKEDKSNLIKDLKIFLLEKDVDQVLKHEFWPITVKIEYNMKYKQIIIKGR